MVTFEILGMVAILAIVSLVINRVNLNERKRARFMKSFPEYASILEYHMQKAYEVIHKDRILTYSLEATRPSEAEVDAISQDFVRLTQKILGPMLLTELLFLYGNEAAFLTNLITYFNTRFEEDEIRKSAINQLTSSEG